MLGVGFFSFFLFFFLGPTHFSQNIPGFKESPKWPHGGVAIHTHVHLYIFQGSLEGPKLGMSFFEGTLIRSFFKGRGGPDYELFLRSIIPSCKSFVEKSAAIRVDYIYVNLFLSTCLGNIFCEGILT
jgi:hypothetical protein